MLVYIRPCKLHHFNKVLGGGGHAPEPPSKAHDSKSENNLCPPPHRHMLATVASRLRLCVHKTPPKSQSFRFLSLTM